jgi:hypothetical protein
MPLTCNLCICHLHKRLMRHPTIPCPFPGCKQSFINNLGLTHHIRKQHSRLQHHSSASPISPPSSPPVVPAVCWRAGSYSSPTEISFPGNPNVTPLDSPNITTMPLSSSKITPLNSPILPINSPFEFPSSPPARNGHSIDNHDGGHDVDQLPAGLPPNPNQGHENLVLS